MSTGRAGRRCPRGGRRTRSRSSSCRPTSTTLAARLRQRATDAPEIIERRLRKAIEELEHFDEYQHLIVNDDLERAYALLRAVYLTRRYGVVDRPDVPYPLAELARMVAATTEASATRAGVAADRAPRSPRRRSSARIGAHRRASARIGAHRRACR